MVVVLKPAVSNCNGATGLLQITAAFLMAYCTIDNSNHFNPFDECALEALSSANLGCAVIQSGIGVSAGLLYLTFLEKSSKLFKKIHFLVHVIIFYGAFLEDNNPIPYLWWFINWVAHQLFYYMTWEQCQGTQVVHPSSSSAALRYWRDCSRGWFWSPKVWESFKKEARRSWLSGEIDFKMSLFSEALSWLALSLMKLGNAPSSSEACMHKYMHIHIFVPYLWKTELSVYEQEASYLSNTCLCLSVLTAVLKLQFCNGNIGICLDHKIRSHPC